MLLAGHVKHKLQQCIGKEIDHISYDSENELILVYLKNRNMDFPSLIPYREEK